ncbi:MAG: universal stress protein [Alphaproteobacteria bacterium]
MKRILVATDLSERSDRAIGRAILLAKTLSARLTVLHVIDDDLPASVAETQKQVAGQSMREHLASIPGAKDLDTNLVVGFGKDWSKILQQADTEQSELVILGLHRKSGLGSMFRGTTVERVVRNGDTPVLVAKNRPTRDYRVIVVGVDFSIYSRRALEFALDFSKNSRIQLVHAYEIPFKGFLPSANTHAEMRKRDETLFREMVDQEVEVFLAGLDAQRGRIEIVVSEGDPHSVINAQVAALDADLLVLGTHGRTGVARAFLGSVAEGFLTDPPADVVAVKAW